MVSLSMIFSDDTAIDKKRTVALQLPYNKIIQF